MSDVTAPVVFSKDMKPHVKDVTGFQRREALRARRVSRASLIGNCVQGVMNIGLATALVYALPLVRVVPVFAWARPDGSTDAAVTQSMLPHDLNEAQKKAWLWQYVRLRESYSWNEAQYDYDVVSGMSAPDVREKYQTWQNAKNKNNYMNTLGKNGVVHVIWRDSDIQGDRFSVRFCRVVEEDGKLPVAEHWIARLAFTELATIPFTMRVTYNASALVVTSYPGATPEGGVGPDIGSRECRK